jgi:hypothetical protein
LLHAHGRPPRGASAADTAQKAFKSGATNFAAYARHPVPRQVAFAIPPPIGVGIHFTINARFVQAVNPAGQSGRRSSSMLYRFQAAQTRDQGSTEAARATAQSRPIKLRDCDNEPARYFTSNFLFALIQTDKRSVKSGIGKSRAGKALTANRPGYDNF